MIKRKIKKKKNKFNIIICGSAQIKIEHKFFIAVHLRHPMTKGVSKTSVVPALEQKTLKTLATSATCLLKYQE